MIRINLLLELNYHIDQNGADFIFNVQAAQTRHQRVSSENLTLNQTVPMLTHTDPSTGNRIMRLTAQPGPLRLIYTATVDLDHHRAATGQIFEVPVRQLPPEVLTYMYPSRYCQSDRLGRLVMKEFGSLWQGYNRVQAIQEWVQRNVKFTSNTSNSNTSALDTLIDQVGVCRDFAHVMIALCRAANLPARMATGTDFGADPALGPSDFHAYVEVFLDNRWYIFDPSGTAIPMAFIRFGTGRDAADVAFATIFGNVTTQAPIISAIAVQDDASGFELPYHCADGLSTDVGNYVR